jgi:uncharacterized zinc-type alcohol dehydrogenase-like protein
MAVKFAVAMGAEVTMLSTSPSKQRCKATRRTSFILSTDETAMKKHHSHFDVIVDTVSPVMIRKFI